MADTPSKTAQANKPGEVKKKRLPKSQRTHTRRVKQEARKTGANPA